MTNSNNEKKSQNERETNSQNESSDEDTDHENDQPIPSDPPPTNVLPTYAAAATHSSTQEHAEEEERRAHEKFMHEQLQQDFYDETSAAEEAQHQDPLFSNDYDSDDEETEHGFYIGFLIKTLVRTEQIKSNRTLRTGINNTSTTRNVETNLAYLATGNGILHPVRITGRITEDKDPKKRPYHLFSIDVAKINKNSHSIDAKDMVMLNSTNQLSRFDHPDQLVAFPRLTGKISKNSNGSLYITPFELVKSNKTKENWKRNNNTELPFASNQPTHSSLMVGDEVSFLLAMGTKGPVAIRVNHAIMVDPASKKSFEHGANVITKEALCSYTGTYKNPYFTNGHTELDTAQSSEILNQLELEGTENAVHLIPTMSRNGNNPWHITFGDIMTSRPKYDIEAMSLDDILDTWIKTRTDDNTLEIEHNLPVDANFAQIRDGEKKLPLVIHYTDRRSAITVNNIVTNSYNALDDKGHDHVSKTLIIAATDSKGREAQIFSQTKCNKLSKVTHFGAGLSTQLSLIENKSITSTTIINRKLSFLSFYDDGNLTPCQITNNLDVNVTTELAEDCSTFTALYLPGNTAAKDKLVKLSSADEKKIKVQFLNSRPVQNPKKRGKNSLFHNKFVRAIFTVINGSTEKIIRELKNAKALVGPVDDLPTKTLKKVTLRSHSWAPFPRSLDSINAIDNITYISIPEKNHFVLYFKNNTTQLSMLEALQIKQAANSLHQTFFAEDQSPWSQVCIQGIDSIVNTTYAQHACMPDNTLLISGFDTPTSSTFIQRLLDNTTPDQSTYKHCVVDTNPSKDGEVTATFLNSPNTQLSQTMMPTALTYSAI